MGHIDEIRIVRGDPVREDRQQCPAEDDRRANARQPVAAQPPDLGRDDRRQRDAAHFFSTRGSSRA